MTQAEVGAAPTTTGRAGTARRPVPGKQDGEVYECRNQWWNPLKWTAGSNLVDMGWYAAARLSTVRAGALRDGLGLIMPEATVKDCGVAVARLQGKSWAPIPSNGLAVNVGTIVEPPTCRPARSAAGRCVVN